MMRLLAWARLSVRQRITAAVALLTTLALVCVGVTVYLVEDGRITAAVDSALHHQIQEFRALVAEGVDPQTQQRFASPDRVLELFLQRNYAAPNEIFWAFPTKGPVSFTGAADDDLETSAEFFELVDENKTRGGVFTLPVDDDVYRVAVQGVGESPMAAFAVTMNVSDARAELHDLMMTYALVSALAVLLLSSFASLIAGRLLKPVRALNDTALAITAGDLSRRIEVTGNDDLTELQVTFNAMLDRLEDAFAAQRRLLDDAAHELRTPLTVLRGHLDVLDVDDVDDVAVTRVLLIDETDRMARLVGDLLMLAKSQRPDFVLPTRIDLSQHLTDVLAKAEALGDRRWTIDSLIDESAAIDGQRITQALLQLIDNAIKHTSAGDEIGLGVTRVGSDIQWWVRDTGPGIASHDREAVFERFHRGMSADDGGFGLGLSIVRAIAQAHGGTVEIDPSGPGATFRITVPWSGNENDGEIV